MARITALDSDISLAGGLVEPRLSREMSLDRSRNEPELRSAPLMRALTAALESQF